MPSPASAPTHCRNLDPRDVTIVNGIPVTTVARTLVDLTDVMDAEQLAQRDPRGRVSGAVQPSKPPARPWTRANGRQTGRARGGDATAHERQRRHAEPASKTGSSSSSAAPGSPSRSSTRTSHGFEVDFRWPGLNVEVDGGHHAARARRARTGSSDAVLRARVQGPALQRR